MWSGIKTHVICLMIATILPLHASSRNLVPSYTFRVENGESVMDATLTMFLKYAKQIRTISEYPESERNLALAKFVEIHDELLFHFITADSLVNVSAIKALLQYLNYHIQNSALMRSSASREVLKPKEFIEIVKPKSSKFKF